MVLAGFALAAGQKHLPRWPVALAIVVLSLVVMPWLDPARHGLRVLGAIPAGLPTFDPDRFRLPLADRVT
jgi:MFS superfamily sulfate permease-like transporter